MSRQPDEFITVPEPPEAITGLGRRIAPALRSAVYGGALVTTGAFLAAIGLNILPPSSLPGDDFGCLGPNHPFRLTEADVAARLRAIQDLIALEAMVRARLSKAQPGVVIPREDLESYK